jgi:hypothetical protein
MLATIALKNWQGILLRLDRNSEPLLLSGLTVLVDEQCQASLLLMLGPEQALVMPDQASRFQFHELVRQRA